MRAEESLRALPAVARRRRAGLTVSCIMGAITSAAKRAQQWVCYEASRVKDHANTPRSRAAQAIHCAAIARISSNRPSSAQLRWPRAAARSNAATARDTHACSFDERFLGGPCIVERGHLRGTIKALGPRRLVRIKRQRDDGAPIERIAALLYIDTHAPRRRHRDQATCARVRHVEVECRRICETRSPVCIDRKA